MGLELEFKYALTGPDQLERLCQALGDAFGPWGGGGHGNGLL